MGIRRETARFLSFHPFNTQHDHLTLYGHNSHCFESGQIPQIVSLPICCYQCAVPNISIYDSRISVSFLPSTAFPHTWPPSIEVEYTLHRARFPMFGSFDSESDADAGEALLAIFAAPFPSSSPLLPLHALHCSSSGNLIVF
ncbi:hypothetical protein PM082_004628 [Marasmius tenuissimus]|nr:hypothetical protein PM082_004628 [Marasmius tenuissimus]